MTVLVDVHPAGGDTARYVYVFPGSSSPLHLDEGAIDTVSILADHDMVEAIDSGRADLAAGDVVDLDEVRRVIAARGD